MNPAGWRFPAEFLWGAATSAYQVEGSPLADGAGPSNWHRFTHEPGRTARGDTGNVACDHYRRWGEDVALMRALELQAYRFSIAWSRIQPEGRGPANAPGLDFYDRLVDALLGAGVQPFVTLFHWDLPAALEDRGGWAHRDSAGWFADYAEIVCRRLGDRVRYWATLNEPWVIVDAGYVHGVHPPGRRDLAAAAQAAHNLLRAHGLAVQAYRALGAAERAGGAGRIGIVVNLEPKDPASDLEEDLAATARADAYMNRHYLDPLFLGRYPDELAGIYGAAWPQHPPADFGLIQEPIDFLGVNYYTRSLTRHDPAGVPERAAKVRVDDAEYTLMNWEVHPASLTRVLRWVKERYGDRPVYITENGAAFADPTPGSRAAAIPGRRGGSTGDDAGGGSAAGSDDGSGGHEGAATRWGKADPLPDPRREAYLRAHIAAVGEAMRAGVDVQGYFVWSLLDNFEWAEGYAKRLGIVYVDHATQERILKRSAVYYRNVIRSRASDPD
ncbi:MAG: family 1 glycosylhydrolase [Candidatus Krumholzibacteriia bacterium]